MKEKILSFFHYLKSFRLITQDRIDHRIELIHNFKKERINTGKLVENLELEIIAYKEQIEQSKYSSEIEKYLIEKYPSRSITWKGRSLPFSKQKINVPVVVLITPNDPFIIRDLKQWKMYKTGEDDETLIPKIYKKIKEKYYKYKHDNIVWGSEEVWEFPFELREKGIKFGFDCDSWAHFQVSYFRAAGVPYWKVFVVCGKTLLGGHSTVEVYSEITKKYHHLNATYGRPLQTQISKYPTRADAISGKDQIGITEVWCSFNDKIARSSRTTKKVEELLQNLNKNEVSK